MDPTSPDLELLRLLAARLERLSADSHWAHRASGVRGQVLRAIEQMEKGEPYASERLIEAGFRVLRLAAREIG